METQPSKFACRYDREFKENAVGLVLGFRSLANYCIRILFFCGKLDLFPLQSRESAVRMKTSSPEVTKPPSRTGLS